MDTKGRRGRDPFWGEGWVSRILSFCAPGGSCPEQTAKWAKKVLGSKLDSKQWPSLCMIAWAGTGQDACRRRAVHNQILACRSQRHQPCCIQNLHDNLCLPVCTQVKSGKPEPRICPQCQQVVGVSSASLGIHLKRCSLGHS